VSEGKIEGLIFWRELRNDVDERGEADQQKHCQVSTLSSQKLDAGRARRCKDTYMFE